MLMQRRRWQLTISLALVLGLLAGYGVFVHTPEGPRSLRAFDPHRVAQLELGMWQAYYKKQTLRLFGLLVVMLREQYRYTWAKAATAGFYLARPASRFAEMKQGYELVIPDLERAFTIAKDWTGAGYEPAAVARAELAWWIARRDPRTNSVDNVGSLISALYALFYDVPVARVGAAGRLRAEAAALRDAGGETADWEKVSALLDRSYQNLHEALQAR
jgi:hypothetical protein